MGNPGGPFGGPYQSQGNQGLPPQLQNKGPLANNLAQFNVDKKNPAMQGMAAMVETRHKLSEKMFKSYAKSEYCNFFSVKHFFHLSAYSVLSLTRAPRSHRQV